MGNTAPGALVFALCSDRNMEQGLHATLFSLVRNQTVRKHGAKIYLFTEGFLDRDIVLLETTLGMAGGHFELIHSPIQLGEFATLPGLHGSAMAYARLCLPHLLQNESRFVYLDADLLVGTHVDLAALFSTELNGRPLAAVSGATVEWALERDFFIEQGIFKNAPYFNSGVLLFDAAAWRTGQWTKRCLDFSKAHAARLATADQTVINSVLQNRIALLPEQFNLPLYNDSAPAPLEELRSRIVHFVGSPKPWDPFGRRLHRSYELFREVRDQTALRGSRARTLSWRRIYRLFGSYVRSFRRLQNVRRPVI